MDRDRNGVPLSFINRKRPREEPKCPGCDQPLALRDVKGGRNMGKRYYTCTDPQCMPDPTKGFMGWEGSALDARIVAEVEARNGRGGNSTTIRTQVPAAVVAAEPPRWATDLDTKLDRLLELLTSKIDTANTH